MAARLLLLPLIVALFSQLVPAKADKSFDNFLKSNHTNNWAVLVRIYNETTLQNEMRRLPTSIFNTLFIFRCAPPGFGSTIGM